MTDWHVETVENVLVNLRLGAIKKLQTQDYRSKGRFPIIDQGQALIAGWTDDDSGVIEKDLPVIVFGDHTRAFKYIDFPFVRGADGTQILKPRPGINSLFFYYALRAIDLPSRGYNRHFKALKEKDIAFPGDSAEQVDIAHVLKLIDDTLAVQDDEIAAWKICKCATMRELFTRGLRGEAQKETEIGPIPESWGLVEFEKVRQRLQYGTSIRCGNDPTPHPVLRIPNITPGRVDPSDLKYAAVSEEEASRHRLEDGDIIFIRTNGVIERLGCCAVFSGEPEGALFASYLIRAQPNLEKLRPHFAAHFYSSQIGTALVAGRATPAADGKYNLNTGIIDSLPLPLPRDLSEQDEIVAILDAIDAKLGLHQRKKSLLEELFRALLYKLMTGEIRVTDIDLSILETEAAA